MSWQLTQAVNLNQNCEAQRIILAARRGVEVSCWMTGSCNSPQITYFHFGADDSHVLKGFSDAFIAVSLSRWFFFLSFQHGVALLLWFSVMLWYIPNFLHLSFSVGRLKWQGLAKTRKWQDLHRKRKIKRKKEKKNQGVLDPCAIFLQCTIQHMADNCRCV